MAKTKVWLIGLCQPLPAMYRMVLLDCQEYCFLVYWVFESGGERPTRIIISKCVCECVCMYTYVSTYIYMYVFVVCMHMHACVHAKSLQLCPTLL